MDVESLFFRPIRQVEASLREDLGLPSELEVRFDTTPLTRRDVELARDRLWTRLALPEPLHDLRRRIRREEGL
jgi:hypothetical protein